MNAKVLKSIEFLRDKMHKLAMESGISHPKVLRVSQMLDTKLNIYNKIIMSQ